MIYNPHPGSPLLPIDGVENAAPGLTVNGGTGRCDGAAGRGPLTPRTVEVTTLMDRCDLMLQLPRFTKSIPFGAPAGAGERRPAGRPPDMDFNPWRSSGPQTASG